jgi:hypothetical protein
MQTLDIFDSFDPYDRKICKNLSFLNDQFKLNETNKYLERYRIKFNFSYFKENSLKIKLENDKIIINSYEDKQESNNDYFFQQFRKSFLLPNYIDLKKSKMFILPFDKFLVIEFPIHLAKKWHKKMLQPKINLKKKSLKFNLLLPENIDGKSLKLICKDRDIVVIANYINQEFKNELFQLQYIGSCTFPVNTDFYSLTCLYAERQLRIKANLF